MRQFILFLFVLLPFCAFPQQVDETFDGPDLEAGWIGQDRSQFVINEDGRLQLNIKPVDAGNATLSRKIAYSADMQWEFEIYMRKEPSNQNRLRICLYQESKTRYYYLQIGNSGKKELGLMRHGNVDMVKPKTEFKSSYPLLLQVKVTLEDNERWNLYYKTKDMPDYSLEGSAVFAIEEPAARDDLSFTFYYSKLQSDLFSIGRVRIFNQLSDAPFEPMEPEEPEEPDYSEVLPRWVDVEPLSVSNLLFKFDKAVEIKDAVFSISDVGDAYEKSYANSETKKVVNTLFENEMQPAGTYTISYKGLKSLSGKAMPDESAVLVLEGELIPEPFPEPDPDPEITPDPVPVPEPEPVPVPEEPDSYPEGTVVINEIMAKPGNAGMVEYIELYNASSGPVSLNQWEYRNISGKKQKALPDVSLEAGGYAVLLDRRETLPVPDRALVIRIDKFPALNDNGATLQLWDAAGNRIDAVSYEKATAGKSWERSDTGWHLSTDPRGGTPGAVNSVPEKEDEQPDEPGKPDPGKPDVPVVINPIQRGEIIINELLPDPYAGGSEYIELYNRSNRILPLSALSVAIRKSDGTLNTRYPLASVTADLDSKGYALLTKSLDGVASFYDIADPSALYQVAKLPVLANTASTLVLFRTADEEVIDEVSYSSKWHAPFIKSAKGVALERIDPDAPTQDPSNWTSASETAGYGTPGYLNSQSKAASSESPTGIEPPVWIEESGRYAVTYQLDRPGYNCRAFIYNMAGMRVAEIANHQLLGMTGEITWDGIARNGSRLQTGVYIFYAEIYHPDGIVKRFKKAFLVR